MYRIINFNATDVFLFADNFSRCEIKLGNRCYWKKDVPLTWHRSREACLNEGGDLASLGTFGQKNLNDSLKDLRLNANKGYWVGLYKDVVWRWNARGFGISHTFFLNCTVIGQMYNVQCTLTSVFLSRYFSVLSFPNDISVGGFRTHIHVGYYPSHCSQLCSMWSTEQRVDGTSLD